MQSVIDEDDGEYVKVYVTDNDGERHDITVSIETGEIAYHSSDAYAPEASNRTVAENELNNQARRFAKFHVYREKGYETVDPHRNPDRLAAATAAVGSLDLDQVAEFFESSYQQLKSYHGESEPIIDVPESVSDHRVRVGQEIYLGVDKSELTAIASTLAGAGVFEQLEAAAGDTDTDQSLVSKLTDRLADREIGLAPEAATIGEHLIETVGPVRAVWPDGQADHIETAPGPVPEREPDAIIQMVPPLYEFDDLAEFHEMLVHHLRCQVRDSYIEMGIAPPKDFRVQGPGFYENVGWYENHDFYPDYYDTRATISDWQEEHTPEELLV